MRKIIHLCTSDKFIPAFIDFVNTNFNINDHQFFILGEKSSKYGLLAAKNVEYVDTPAIFFRLCKTLSKEKKIIIHGLWKWNCFILMLNPWILKKCYWVMWGGDFYSPEKQNWVKKKIIQKTGHSITYIEGDYNLAQRWYGANGKYHECFMYPSNLYKKYDLKTKKNRTINILVGNSADPTNNHIEVFENLKKYKGEDIKIIVPLSYNGEEYANEITKIGREMFGNKFEALTEFIPFDKYLELLAEIDVAIFNHKRQQAMGNIITLLGLGKKVFMRDDITSWVFFKEKNITLYNVDYIDMTTMSVETKIQNIANVKQYFSKDNLKKQWALIFESE